MPIAELGHVGLYTDDLGELRDFYTRVLGLTVTDEHLDAGLVFLSSRPDEEHHELVLCRSNTPPEGRWQQMSFRCPDLATVREFWRRFTAESVRIQRVVSHGNAIGIYFYDPQGNRCEVYTRAPFVAKQPFAVLVDLDEPEDVIWAKVRAAVEEYGASGTPLDHIGPEPKAAG